MNSTSQDEPLLQENPIPTSDEEVNLLQIALLLKRHKKFILWFTLGSTLLSTVIVFLIPNKYTATSVILPPTQSSSMSSALMGQLAGSGALASLAGASLGIKNPADMYVSLFRSRTVEDALIQKFHLMERFHTRTMVDTRSAFEDRATVTLGVKDGLIKVAVTDRDPNFAAQLANAYVDEFRKHTDSLSISEASQRRAFFQQQLEDADNNLAKAELALKNTQQSTGVLQLDSQARALIESASVLRAQIAAKEVELQSMRSFATQDNPQVIVAQQQLEALKAQLAKLGGSSSGFSMANSNLSQAGLAYLNSYRDLRYYETVEELLARQFEAAKLDEAREGSIQISDVAVPPDKKSSPKRALLIAAVLFASLLVSVLYILFREAILKKGEITQRQQTLAKIPPEFGSKQRI